jgi:hypothetical protein
MDARELATTQALGRLGIGVAMLAAPERMTVPWVGAAGARRGTRVLTRALGAREIALGIGQARAVRAGFGVRPWLVGGVIADAVDLVATSRSRGDLPLLGVIGVGAIAASSTALGAYLASRLD